MYTGDSVWIKLYYTNSLSLDQEEISIKRRQYYFIGNTLNFMSGIDLSSNQLGDNIPEFERSWEHGPIHLSHNILTGPVPRELQALQSLEVFSFAYNNLSDPTLGIEGQFITFAENCYIGNPDLCSPPLANSCYTAPPRSPSYENAKEICHQELPKQEGHETFDAAKIYIIATIQCHMFMN